LSSEKKSAFSKTILWDLSLLCVALIWGGGFVITKVCVNIMPPMAFLGYKFTAAGIIMFLIFRKNIMKAKAKDFLNGSIIGVFLAIAFITQTIGIMSTTPAKSSFITGLNVVIVPFLVWMIYKRSPGKKAYISAVVAFLGMGLLSLNFSEAMWLSFGDFMTLLCAIFFAAHITSVGFFANKTDALVIAATQVLFTGIVCMIASLLFEVQPDVTTWSPSIWVGMIYSVFLSTLAAFLIQNVAQTKTPSSHAAIILCLESVFGAMASAIFYGEILSMKMIIGCVLIFGAILANEVDFKALMDKKAA